MMTSLMTKTMAALALSAVLLGGCKKKKDEPQGAKRPPILVETERARAEQACMDYVMKVCTCSKMKPENTDMAKRCEREKALPDALHVAIGIDADPSTPTDAVMSAQQQVRKIVKTCVEGLNEIITSAEFTGCM